MGHALYTKKAKVFFMYPQILNFRRKHKKGMIKMNKFVSRMLVLLLLLSCVCVVAYGMGDREATSATVTSVGEVLLFGENLELTPLAPLSESYNFSVNESPTIAYEFASAKSVGKAYRFYPEGVDFEAPIQITMPLNCTGVEGMLIVIAREASGDISFIAPDTVNWTAKAVTFITSQFSVFEPYDFPIGYTQANVTGNLYLAGDYEESPEKCVFDFFCANTESNESANFVVLVDGLTSYHVLPPIPDLLFGTYEYRSLIGSSDNFLFSACQANLSVPVSEAGANYSLDIPVVATTSRLIGAVRDADGNTVEGALVIIRAGANLSYETLSREDGNYTIAFIGMEFDTPAQDMNTTYTYSVTDGELPCVRTDSGAITLHAGRTLTKDFALTGLQFGTNLELKPLRQLRESYNFSVNESPSIAYELAGAKSVGKAYRFYPEGVKFEVPIRVTLPLNVTGVEGELIVIARDESGNTTFIVPEKVDWDSKAVTFCTRHFSDFEPYEFLTSEAYISLNVRLDGDYEESPSEVSVVLMGEKNRVELSMGLGIHSVLVPEYFFGVYSIFDAEGTSEHFYFVFSGSDTSVNIILYGATYELDVPLVALTGRMTGTVRDSEGNPLEGADVGVVCPGSDYDVKSKAGGSYTLEDIDLCGNKPKPYPNMVATGDCYAEYDESEEKCPLCNKGGVTLRAGKTKTQDITLFDDEIFIDGEITDMNGEYVEGAKVEITDSAGNKNSTTAHIGLYTLFAIAPGKAELKATCENGKDTQTKIVDLNCKEDSQVDFVLDCNKGNYNGYHRAFFEAGDPNGIGGAGYQSFLDEYDFTFDIDDDGMINGSGLGYSEWEVSWRYDEYKHKERVTCKTGPMPFSVEIRGQREGDNLLLEPDFYSDAHVIWDCTPSGEAPLHEGADWGELGPCLPLDRVVPIISEEPFEACFTLDVDMLQTRTSIYCHITE